MIVYISIAQRSQNVTKHYRVEMLWMLSFCLLQIAWAYIPEEPLLYDHFPADFIWGVATAAYQIEGGWNEGGKSLNIWDTFTKIKGNIIDGSNGDVACDSYHKYKEDVQLMKNLGIQSYRFSISWARILPDGTGRRNQEGIDYYNNLIDELLANNVIPAVTLYHWDLPQDLHVKHGGWLNPDVAYWFEEYARVCFEEFGDRVKLWITLNEPKETSVQGYGTGTSAPGKHGIGTLTYIAAHNQIRAHARAYRAYQQDFAAEQGGKCGITLNVNWAEPRDPDKNEDAEASHTHLQFHLGWYAHAILKNGKYPDIMRSKIDQKSAQQGFKDSRLPKFTEEESAMIAGSSDFLGLNFYTSNIVYPEERPVEEVSYFSDSDVGSTQDQAWYCAGSSWLKVTPWGIRKALKWVSREYGKPDIYITENGFSDKLGNLDDLQRVYYYKHYINQVLKAVSLDGVSVKGYFAWSLIDNFEWDMGYTQKFGLHRVNMSDPGRARTPKESAFFYARIIQENGFVRNENIC